MLVLQWGSLLIPLRFLHMIVISLVPGRSALWRDTETEKLIRTDKGR